MRSEASKQKDGTMVSETIADKETGLALWQSEHPRLRYAWLFLLVVIMLSSMFVTTKTYAAARFGTRCQSDYQNSWQESLPYQWKRCAGFNNELDDTDTKVFYFNLQGPARSRFSTCDGLTTDETGEDFADGLQKRKKVKWAWFDGNSDWYCDQDVAVFATGSSLTGAKSAEADCNYRRDNVKWQNFGSYAKWRDSQIGWMCWAYID